MSHSNRHLQTENMRREEAKVRTLDILCGNVAHDQLKKGLHFIQEQPHPSNLYHVHPWPLVLRIEGICQITYDRCACGLKVGFGPHKGLFLKKPSSMTASHPELLKPFLGKDCKHRPDQHLSGDGHPKELSAAQVWTWIEAHCIIQGILNLRRLTNVVAALAFPVRSADDVAKPVPGVPDGKDPRAPNRHDCKCKACKAGWRDIHWEHTRKIGECQYPHHEPWIPRCAGCWAGKPLNIPMHTLKMTAVGGAIKPPDKVVPELENTLGIQREKPVLTPLPA